LAVTRKRAIGTTPRIPPGTWTKQKRNHFTGGAVAASATPGDPAQPLLNLQGTQVTVSESHPQWRTGDRSAGDVGGNFSTVKSWCTNVPTRPFYWDSGWYDLDGTVDERVTYRGPMYIAELTTPGVVALPPSASSSVAALNAYGATAIARCAPTKPTANLLTSLLEVYREGLPKMFGKDTWESRVLEAKAQPRAGASEFLNYQFGVLPLISDVQDFVKAVINMDKLLQQYMRDNGQVVRRRFTFPPEVQSVESVISATSNPGMGTNGARMMNYTASPRGRVLRSRQTTKERWFSGAFVYHLPQTFFAELYIPFADQFQVFRKILGLELTPDVLWELTPWSWAVDWFSNVGDVIHNTNSWINDGLVMKYGYIMEHTIVHDTYTFVGPTNTVFSPLIRPPDVHLVTETKLRQAANPFGFGLTMDGLSTVQKAILAAVGLTRLR